VEVNISSDKAGNAGCGGGDGRVGVVDHLNLVAVSSHNMVVGGSQVGASHDEVDVEVSVIILLEVSRLKFLSGLEMFSLN